MSERKTNVFMTTVGSAKTIVKVSFNMTERKAEDEAHPLEPTIYFDWAAMMASLAFSNRSDELCRMTDCKLLQVVSYTASRILAPVSFSRLCVNLTVGIVGVSE